MTEYSVLISLTVLLAAALVGGMIAHRLKQPVILGYLVIGAAVGPYGFGLVADRALTEAAATIGVALLMLTLGMEVSFSQFRQVGRIGLWGGIAQILGTAALGTAAGLFIFHWSVPQAVLFGLVIYNSSTAICLKVLMERGELDSMHGRIMIAILILQDVAVTAMMVVTPILGEPLANLLMAEALAAGKAIVFTGIAVVLGLWVLPWLLGRLGGVRSRELFLLTVLTMSLGAAIGTYVFGLSVVFGSFLVGFMLRQSRFAHEALAEVTPLRDIFAALFFVSLGMLFDFRFVLANWWLVLATVALIIAIKMLVVFAIVRLFGFGTRVATFAAGGLLQVGEFGFILAQAGVSAGIATPDFYSLILAAATITMILTPASLSLVARACPWLATPTATTPATQVGGTLVPGDAPGRVLVAGYGRVGRNLALTLRETGIDCTIIEIDPELILDMRRQGIRGVYGDATNTLILKQASADTAAIIVVTYPDPLAVVTTVRNALRLNPRLKVIARVHRSSEARELRALGVTELVSPEYEASLNFARRVLSASGWAPSDIDRSLESLQAPPAALGPRNLPDA